VRRALSCVVLGILLGLARMALASEVLLQAPRSTAPLSPSPSYRQGLALDLRGDHAAAAEAYRAAAAAEGGGRAGFHEKLSEGIARTQEALPRAPDSWDHHFNLGVHLQNKYWAIFVDLGIRSERLFFAAEHHFRAAMRLSPAAANPVLCLAALYAQAGDRPRAIETFGQLGRRPIGPADIYNLAFYHKVVGDLDRAFRDLERALRHDSRHREWILESDDFAEYRDDPRLKRLLGKQAPQRLYFRGLGIGQGTVLQKLLLNPRFRHLHQRLRQHRARPGQSAPSPSPARPQP
jgi:tetratricopeptide (TPR) repeat protein